MLSLKKIFFVFLFLLSFKFFELYAAWYQWDISGWLKEKYLEVNSDERFEKLAKDYNFANLYKIMYEEIQIDDLKSVNNSISRLKNFLIKE
jgi:5,10-methylenetetrahydrofolate reductase